MWPLHSRTRPLGHRFTSESARRPRAVAVAAADAADAKPDAKPDADATPPAPAPAPTVSARRRKWQRRLSSRAFHVLVLGLVLLDLCTIVVDLVLVLTHSEYRPTERVEEASRALAATSIAILSLFMAEFSCAAAAFGPRVWFGEPLHWFDVCVVVASLSLEAALFHLESKQAGLESIASLLVLGRLWRLARVAYTATEAQEAVHEVRGGGGHGGGGVGGGGVGVGGGVGGGGLSGLSGGGYGGGGGLSGGLSGGGAPAREVLALRQEVAALRALVAEAGLRAPRLVPQAATGREEEEEEQRRAAAAAAAGGDKEGRERRGESRRVANG